MTSSALISLEPMSRARTRLLLPNMVSLPLRAPLLGPTCRHAGRRPNRCPGHRAGGAGPQATARESGVVAESRASSAAVAAPRRARLTASPPWRSQIVPKSVDRSVLPGIPPARTIPIDTDQRKHRTDGHGRANPLGASPRWTRRHHHRVAPIPALAASPRGDRGRHRPFGTRSMKRRNPTGHAGLLRPAPVVFRHPSTWKSLAQGERNGDATSRATATEIIWVAAGGLRTNACS
jgi:hypothetical protein